MRKVVEDSSTTVQSQRCWSEIKKNLLSFDTSFLLLMLVHAALCLRDLPSSAAKGGLQWPIKERERERNKSMLMISGEVIPTSVPSWLVAQQQQ